VVIAGVLALVHVDSDGPDNYWRDADFNRGGHVYRTGAGFAAHPAAG